MTGDRAPLRQPQVPLGRTQVPLGRLLALDVGSKRIGVAVCDELGFIATPLTVIHHTSKQEDFTRIAGLVTQERAEGIVIGHPLNDDGSAGPQAHYVEKYAAELEADLGTHGVEVPIVLWDEYGSTQHAQQTMIKTGRGARERRERLDAVAAAAILQDYLDAHRPPPLPPPPEGEEPETPEEYLGSPEER